MEKRTPGRTGGDVSVLGLGCRWLGADRGSVSEDDATSGLQAALDPGVTPLDAADVHGGGRGEPLIGRLLRDRPDAGLTVVTTTVRRAEPLGPPAAW